MSKIPFGLDADGNYRNAHEVSRGLACDCVCPVCDLDLVAKQGTSVVWHFAHASENTGHGTSVGCGESAIHKLAKKVLLSANGKILHLPGLSEYEIGTARGQFRCKLIECKDEFLIKEINRRVDVWATTQIVRDAWPKGGMAGVDRRGGPLIIEINVRNRKDGVYIEDVSKAKVSAVEITLSTEDVLKESSKGSGDGLSALKRLVLGPRSANRRWLHFEPAFLGQAT